MRESLETRLIEIVSPTHTNSMGMLFGGHALSLMDRLAFMSPRDLRASPS